MGMIDQELIAQDNLQAGPNLEADYAHLAAQLGRRGIQIEQITQAVGRLRVGLPSWAVGTGGTRFGRFPGPGEPRNILEKLEDVAVVNQLTSGNPSISTHYPWDAWSDYSEVKEKATGLGLDFDAVNSNTFQDQPGQALSYKFGSLSHTDPAVRQQAIEHNLECIRIGQELGSRALTVWIADGSNYPGQSHFARAFARYLESLKQIAAGLPAGWPLFIEHKFFEPAFYSTVLADWGSSFIAAREVGEPCRCLVDLGHQAPGVNVEQIVSRLIQFGKLGGFHFNDSKYGDDDLETGSLNPYQLFLVFCELAEAGAERFAYMIDQSHNITDPLESLIFSTAQIQRAYAQALLVDRAALAEAQENNDALLATQILKAAYQTDVGPILATARQRSGGAIQPIPTYRASGYRQQVAQARSKDQRVSGGIV
jgi:L-rhamnose isomerase/sugar isomerase